MEICLWPRGDYVIEHLQPHILPLPDPNRVVLQLIRELAAVRPDESVDKDSWLSACRNLEIHEKTASGVFENVSRPNSEPKTALLCLDLFLLSFRPQKSQEYSRDDLIAEFFHNNILLILKILLLDPVDSVPDHFLSSLDLVFEGMIESRPEKASRIIRLMWSDITEADNLKPLAKRMSVCLIPDPFRICHFRDQPSTSSFMQKRTSLAPKGRRMVSITGWKRLQLLTKHVYREAHLRIYNACENPSPVYALAFSLSAVVENVEDCPCLLLGPCRGTVHLKNIKNSTITVICRRLIIDNLENSTIFLSSSLSPIILNNCESIMFAPFNACYTGFQEELRIAGLKIPGFYKPEGKNGSWNLLPVEKFYVQPVPVVWEDLDYQKLLISLPDDYRRVLEAQEKLAHTANDENEEESSPLRISDILYLKTKVIDDPKPSNFILTDD